MDEPARPRVRIVGGPICSRAGDGASLRVNLLPPGGRLCSFECSYCSFPSETAPRRWPAAGEVGCAVANALHRDTEVRSIVVSGPGEPTSHPSFGLALAEILAARRARPELAVRVATNGACLVSARMRRLLEFADERIVRIDAGGERIDRPRAGPTREEILEALRQLSDFSAESVFVAGFRGNLNDGDVAEWMVRLAEIRPRHVYVTTVASMPVSGRVRPARPATLERIAADLRCRTGLEGEVIV